HDRGRHPARDPRGPASRHPGRPWHPRVQRRRARHPAVLARFDVRAHLRGPSALVPDRQHERGRHRLRALLGSSLAPHGSRRRHLWRAAHRLLHPPRRRLCLGRPAHQGPLMATDAVTATVATLRQREARRASAGLWRDALWRLRRDPTTLIALTVIGVMVILALAAPLLGNGFFHKTERDQDILSNYTKPTFAQPWLWLGTDELGRSQIVR